MARKKNLEKEFERRKNKHKYTTIYCALMTNPKLFNNKLLKIYKNMVVKPLKGYEDELTFEQTKAYRVEENLKARVKAGETTIYDEVYELCWKKVGKIIDEILPVGID